MHRASPAAVVVALGLLLAPAPARADMLLLTDGRVVEGVKVEKKEGAYLLHYKNGDVVIPVAMVKDALLEGAQGYEPRDDAEREKLAKGLVPYGGKWVPKSDRDAAIAKRAAEKRKAIEDARAHREWRNRYMTKGRNFNFEYTIPPDVCESYRELMESYFLAFTKKWGLQRPPKLGPLKVCFYHDYETMIQVGGAGRGVLGYYQFRPIDSLQLNLYYDRYAPDDTYEVMFHETNHYLFHLVDLGFSYPHCMGEAMAEYYGASKWDPVRKEVRTGGILEGRLTEVQTDFQGGEFKSLEKYLTNQLGYDDYTWGWSFVHFMMETPKYSQKFQQFFLALARARDVERIPDGDMKTVKGEEILRAYKKYMGVKDLDAIEKEWHEYVKNNLKLESSRGYEQAATAALYTGRPLKAKRFFGMAVDKGCTNPVTYKTYGNLLVNEDKVEEGIAILKRGILIDPLFASLYAFLGRATIKLDGEANIKEGKRLIELAREIDPDDVDLEFLLEEALKKLNEGGK